MVLPCLGDKKLIEGVRGMYMKGSAQGRRRSGHKYHLPPPSLRNFLFLMVGKVSTDLFTKLTFKGPNIFLTTFLSSKCIFWLKV